MPEMETNFPGEEEEILKEIRITTEQEMRPYEKLRHSILEFCKETAKRDSKEETSASRAKSLQRVSENRRSASKTGKKAN